MQESPGCAFRTARNASAFSAPGAALAPAAAWRDGSSTITRQNLAEFDEIVRRVEALDVVLRTWSRRRNLRRSLPSFIRFPSEYISTSRRLKPGITAALWRRPGLPNEGQPAWGRGQSRRNLQLYLLLARRLTGISWACARRMESVAPHAASTTPRGSCSSLVELNLRGKD